MNVLVTGVAGFIGARLADLLLSQGHTVLGLDNLNDAYDVRLKYWRLKGLMGRTNFAFRKLDICHRDALCSVFQQPINAVVNLAARTGVQHSVLDPWLYYDTNVIGLLNLLDCCVRFQVKKFVQASASSVYGLHSDVPFSETDITDEPLSPYAATKKAGELLLHTYRHLYGLGATVLRYFTVYGPAGRPDMSLFRFVQRIIEGKTIVVYGDGLQQRDFTYIDDITKGTLAALNSDGGYRIINLGSGLPVSLLHAIALIEELVGEKAIRDYRPSHSADMVISMADISRAKALLDWEPSFSLENGLGCLVEWYHLNRDWAKELNTEAVS